MRPQAPIFFRLAMSGSSSLFCSSDASRPTSVESGLIAGGLDGARIHSMQAWILQLHSVGSPESQSALAFHQIHLVSSSA